MLKFLKDTKIKRLQAEVDRLQKEAQDVSWGVKKTNEGIKILYRELERKNKELKELDKLKSEFVSTVSHELRTPMTIIKESIAQMSDGICGDINEKQERVLFMALANINRLAKIINDLLDISKFEAGKLLLEKSLFDIGELTREVCEGFQAQAQKHGLALKVGIEDDKIEVYADRDKMIQVFTNLIGNAIKFTGKGSITIKVKGNADKTVECSVQDTGKGISEDDLPKVFDKFQQFGRQDGPGEKGTGLGLLICKKIIDLHKGTIDIESQIGLGTVIIFTIPCLVDESYILKGEEENHG
ncbi:MAG: HAMP domain-containing histidine kinase [Candidatus Omnitrophica bacterium]|nr:HAMP domain-containing histidine kinase [Candidatus Omnitrophota bacterium]